MKLIVIDGNYYVHRAFSIAVYTRDPAYVERNVLTLFLTMVVGDVMAMRATHVAVTFDAPRCWRLDVYKDYKANRRNKKAEPIYVKHKKYPEPVKVTVTAGSLIPAAKKLIKAAGLKAFHKEMMESDDLIKSVVDKFESTVPIVVSTRDKDMASLVSDKVVQYWPAEKKLMSSKAIKNYYGVQPFQIRDYLALVGDKIDNIPGVPGVGPKTAASMLGEGTLVDRLKASAKLRAKLKPHMTTLALARKLTTLKVVELKSELEDLVPKVADKQVLSGMVWAIPKGLDSFRDVAQASKFKGLFSKIKR